MFNYWIGAGRIEVAFLGAAQVDRYANLNSTVIGDYDAPEDAPAGRRRGARDRRELRRGDRGRAPLKRTFVECLDFLTTVGHGDGPGARERLGFRGRGPTSVITDKGVLEPDPETCELVLTAIHPGVTVEDVREATGWELRVAADLQTHRAAHRRGARRAAGADEPMSTAYVVDAIRAPFGRYGGGLAGVRPDDLGAHVVKSLIERAPDLDHERIDEVIFGDANQAGEDNRNVARMAILLAGLPTSIPGSTVNRLCGSSLDAAMQASRQIETGEADVVLVGGVESMSRAPWVLLKTEKPYPRGHEQLYSTTLGWRMVNPNMPEQWTISLGESAEKLAEIYEIPREAQDEFALRSHQRAAAAWDDGFYAEWVIPVPDTELDRDENIRADTSLEKLAKLKPAFAKDGTVTAGNSSPLNDGAGAAFLASEKGAEALGREPLARVVARGAAAVDPDVFGIAPVEAANRALERAGITWDDVEVVELNEAFASQCLADIGQWKELDPERVNPNGGAIALGHPLGASGVRILGGLAHELKRRGGGYGVAALVHRRRPGAGDRAGGGMTDVKTDEPRRIYDQVSDTPTSYLREPPDAHPPIDYPGYKSTALRHPKQPLIYLPQTITEITGPQLSERIAGELDNDLTRQHEGEPIGERITVSGRVFDTEGKPLRGTLVEIWQANAAGRYLHRWDRWPAPLDPNFSGAGRTVTDDDGRYTFTTIKPGPYPVGQPPQRLAPGPHPLLAHGPRVHPAAGHPDVLPGRPVLPV